MRPAPMHAKRNFERAGKLVACRIKYEIGVMIVVPAGPARELRNRLTRAHYYGAQAKRLTASPARMIFDGGIVSSPRRIRRAMQQNVL